MLFNMVLPGAVEVVPPDENTLLLLHGEDLTDGSIYGNTVTNSGVTVSTAQSKFGGKSLYFNGSSSLKVANLLSGSMPFTIDAWVYPTKTSTCTIWSHGGSNTPAVTGGVMSYFTSNNFIYYCNGFLIQSASNYPINRWYHIAFVGDGTSIKLYVDGSLVGTYSGAYNFSNVVETFGENDTVPGNENFQGYVDELRVSNVVRWESNFTPPTEPYNPGTGTVGGSDITYTGNYIDNRINGKGTVRLNTSGVLTVAKSIKVTAVIQAAGGGGIWVVSSEAASGGGGGNQTVEIELAAGTYEIVIGTGGASGYSPSGYSASAGNGGNTSAFGITSVGGKGASCPGNATAHAGSAGSPNATAGSVVSGYGKTVSGGSPNGGSAQAGYSSSPGGDGYVELTFI